MLMPMPLSAPREVVGSNAHYIHVGLQHDRGSLLHAVGGVLVDDDVAVSISVLQIMRYGKVDEILAYLLFMHAGAGHAVDFLEEAEYGFAANHLSVGCRCSAAFVIVAARCQQAGYRHKA